MAKVIRTSIVFDFYPDEDEVMSELSVEDQMAYCIESTIENIYSIVKYDEIADAIDVEVVDV
jgi:hypothetical protein